MNISYRNTQTGDIFTSSKPNARLERLERWERVGHEPADAPEPTAGTPSIPPKVGKGSSRAAWAKYAETQGVTVSEDMSRDDIWEALGV